MKMACFSRISTYPQTIMALGPKQPKLIPTLTLATMKQPLAFQLMGKPSSFIKMTMGMAIFIPANWMGTNGQNQF